MEHLANTVMPLVRIFSDIPDGLFYINPILWTMEEETTNDVDSTY